MDGRLRKDSEEEGEMVLIWPTATAAGWLGDNTSEA